MSIIMNVEATDDQLCMFMFT